MELQIQNILFFSVDWYFFFKNHKRGVIKVWFRCFSMFVTHTSLIILKSRKVYILYSLVRSIYIGTWTKVKIFFTKYAAIVF
jgi:hypothetical protein